jgi:hypothetical protein
MVSVAALKLILIATAIAHVLIVLGLLHTAGHRPHTMVRDVAMIRLGGLVITIPVIVLLLWTVVDMALLVSSLQREVWVVVVPLRLLDSMGNVTTVASLDT